VVPVLHLKNPAKDVLLKIKIKVEKVNGVVKSDLAATAKKSLIFVLIAQIFHAIFLKQNY